MEGPTLATPDLEETLLAKVFERASAVLQACHEVLCAMMFLLSWDKHSRLLLQMVGERKKKQHEP